MVRPMAKRLLALGGCVLVCALFLVFQGGKVALMLFVMVLILALYLLLGRWSGIARVTGARDFANRKSIQELEAGTALDVQLQFRVPGFWPIPYVIVKEKLIRHNGELRQFETSFVPDWRRSGQVAFSTPPLARGNYHFADSECLTEDVFGLFRHQGKAATEKAFRVLPRTVAIKEWRQFNHLAKGSFHHSASTLARRETTQINGVREYVYGDRISRIHWNASARTGIWKSKEFEREALPKLLFILDASQASYKRQPQLFELAVSTTASLLRYGLHAHLSQGLLLLGANPFYAEPTRDHHQYRQYLQQLVTVEADGSKSFNEAVNQWLPQLDRHSFVIVISPDRQSVDQTVLTWLKKHQLSGCHLWTDFTETEQEGNHTVSQPSRGVKRYMVRKLEELPSLLGGRAG